MSTGTAPTYPTSSGNATTALVLGVIGLLGSLASLLPTFAELLGLPMAKWPAGVRFVSAAALLIVGLLAGTSAYKATLPMNTGAQQSDGAWSTNSGTTVTVTV